MLICLLSLKFRSVLSWRSLQENVVLPLSSQLQLKNMETFSRAYLRYFSVLFISTLKFLSFGSLKVMPGIDITICCFMNTEKLLQYDGMVVFTPIIFSFSCGQKSNQFCIIWCLLVQNRHGKTSFKEAATSTSSKSSFKGSAYHPLANLVNSFTKIRCFA